MKCHHKTKSFPILSGAGLRIFFLFYCCFSWFFNNWTFSHNCVDTIDENWTFKSSLCEPCLIEIIKENKIEFNAIYIIDLSSLYRDLKDSFCYVCFFLFSALVLCFVILQLKNITNIKTCNKELKMQQQSHWQSYLFFCFHIIYFVTVL